MRTRADRGREGGKGGKTGEGGLAASGNLFQCSLANTVENTNMSFYHHLPS